MIEFIWRGSLFKWVHNDKWFTNSDDGARAFYGTVRPHGTRWIAELHVGPMRSPTGPACDTPTAALDACEKHMRTELDKALTSKGLRADTEIAS